MPAIVEDDILDDQFSELNTPVVSLKKALPVNELINEHQTEFEVKPEECEDDLDNATSAESCFDFDDIQKVINLNLIEGVELANGEIGTPFDKYRLKMQDIRGDGKLLKYIDKQGVGSLVPDNCIVYIRYQAHLEYAEVPFDSTLWQCNGKGDLPVPYNLGKGQLLPGLHEAILSMKKGEKSEFLINPDLAYGSMGCPPRVPGDATVLFIVEVDRFVDCGDILTSEDMSMEERKQYSNCKKIAKAHYVLGNDLFGKENYSAAAKKYRLVINSLHNARLSNEEEEKDRNHFLLKNYTNVCVCYHKLKQYNKVCSMVADALNVNQEEALKNCKLLYFWGYAKMMLCDYNAAKKHLLAAKKLAPLDRAITDALKEAAKKLAPLDRAITDALKELDRKKSHDLEREKIMMQKAFGFKAEGAKIKEIDETEEAFRDLMIQQFREFANSNRATLVLRDHFTQEEERVCLDVAKEIGLYARVIDGEKRIIHIKRPDN